MFLEFLLFKSFATLARRVYAHLKLDIADRNILTYNNSVNYFVSFIVDGILACARFWCMEPVL